MNSHSEPSPAGRISGLTIVVVGTGKTYSTSRVIDWVEKGLETNTNDEGFAYFYCNKQDYDRSEPKAILRSIIRQLATGPWTRNGLSTNAVVHKTVHDLWRKDRERGTLSTFEEWEACLLELIDTYPRTTIVLDALDECNKDRRHGLINLLVKLVTPRAGTTSVKVFVAARPEDDICRQLEKYHRIQMQQQHNADDIACFVQTKLAEHPRWPKMSHDFQNELVTKLLEKTGPMFLFASLQVQRLLDCDTRIALQNCAATLPDSLKTTYTELFHAATSDPDERKIVVKALQWVFCSTRPLTTPELLFVISQDSESHFVKPPMEDLDEDLMLKWTRNLLHLEELDYNALSGFSRQRPRRVWRMAHQAVAEFLEHSSCCKSGRAHCEAGKVCLSMLLDKFGGDPTECSSDTHEVPTLKVQPEMTKYAVFSWPTHVRAQEGCTGPAVDALSHRLLRFLGRPGDGTSAYFLWQREVDLGPTGTIFSDRRLRGAMMDPIVLACHLGILTTLSEWWSSATFEPNRSFYLTGWSTRYPKLRRDPEPSHTWSLLSLACVHNETNIIEHLLERRARLNTDDDNEVPPVVAAVMANSVRTTKRLIECGADVCSPFTLRHGNLLRIAIRNNSLEAMKFLLQQPAFSTPQLVEACSSLECDDFESGDSIELLIDKRMDVNTPLRVGTLLLAAAKKGWQNTVYRLLEEGAAEINPQADLGKYRRTRRIRRICGTRQTMRTAEKRAL